MTEAALRRYYAELEIEFEQSTGSTQYIRWLAREISRVRHCLQLRRHA